MSGIPTSLSTFFIFVVLLPGFITLLVERTLVQHRQSHGVMLIANALVYAFINYSLYALFRLQLPSITTKMSDNGITEFAVNAHWPHVLIILAFSVVLGIIIGLFKTNDWHMKFARGIRLTKRSSRVSIWNDVFQDYTGRIRNPEKTKGASKKKKLDKWINGAWVRVRLKSGDQILGWPRHFADDFENGPALFLTHARWEWASDNKERAKIPDPGIFIMGPEISYIELEYKKTRGDSANDQEEGRQEEGRQEEGH